MHSCVVVSGPPCAGKSGLAILLATRAGWPLLAKDTYKERVFDRLGAGDRDWSRQVSGLAWDLLLDEAARLYAAGVSCVLEGNFRDRELERLALLRPAPRYVEIRASARAEVLLGRYHKRAASGSRHPGHVDLQALAEIEREVLSGAQPERDLGGAVLGWDTSGGFDSVPLLAALDLALAPG